MLLCGAWNSPVVVDSLGKPGSETVLFVWGLGRPGGWGKPGGKKGLLLFIPVRRDLPKGGVELKPAAAIS